MKPDEFRLAIIGGCAASQKGIPLSRLYHRILSARWKSESGQRLKVILDRYDQSINYAPRVERCLDREASDSVLLHIRPSPYLFRCKPLIRYADAMGATRWALHPKLLPLAPNVWNPRWDGETLSGGADSETDVYPQFKESRLRGLHAWLGMVLGLGRWSRAQELVNLAEVRRLCASRNKKLYVLGPTPFLRSRAENRLCQDLSIALRKALAGTEVVFIDPFWPNPEEAKTRFLPDLWHLNSEGHARLSDTLFRALQASRLPALATENP